ncbi:uncharacterized protein MYCFIDRAFT_82421 [Pseudocercospora fijiensis CIRAD86]|uniref:Nuclear pore complex component n=1 Tax=Pseudocercospora fijiensis (strain CIRAD86) TaxID=383855 RepID=M3AZ78_PSEFD|nr:uncharacterized protein MYCFIDRAFT_82421 [Pseudocercospora fijiensis CIRAD86]EME82517.1 hypothetical protein MYCFIDRAFT_82421 [Pseudocercospora fijiensis CIRAD86]
MSSTALAPTSQSISQTASGQKSSSPLTSTMSSLPTLNLTPKKEEHKSNPETPKQQTGQWVHPRMDEVIRRRNATNFDSSNMQSILVSSAFLVVSLFLRSVLGYTFPLSWLRAVHPYPLYAIWLLQAVLVANIGIALLPLFRKPDACEDVPLTPQQRQLLGLPPMSRPATPQEKEQYVTPPRFSNSTPRSSPASSLRAEASSSPLSGRSTPLDGSFRSGSGSPFASQTLRRAESGSPLSGPAAGLRSGAERRRLSYTGNSGSPLALGAFDSSSFGSTPSKEKRASVGLNNKWLYEKGRGSPRGSPRLSGSFGGSVFS